MKNHLQKSFLPALIVGSNLIIAWHLKAQTFGIAHSFVGPNEAANPSGLILSGKTLFGTTSFGGVPGNGTVFTLNSDGSGYRILYSFTATNGLTGANQDGAQPNGVILSGATLYGTTTFGGTSGNGTVFAVNTDGTGFTNLHSFTALDAATETFNSDGVNPYAPVIVSGTTLYGTAQAGGSTGNGTVFALNTDGTGFTNLYSFTALDATTGLTNSDGASPFAPLVLSSNTLYGAAQAGGSGGNGTLFALKVDGTGFTNLHTFTLLDAATQTVNTDGAQPFAGLLLSGTTLYGAAYSGGASGNGTVFSLNTDGTGFTNLHSFTALDVTGTTNSDGANPIAGLILLSKTLFGTAYNGGPSGNGTVFGINANGTGLAILHNFSTLDAATQTTNFDGANPATSLIPLVNTLYGAAFNGGSFGNGTIFDISLPASELTIALTGTNIFLAWPTNAGSLILESATNLVSPTWTPVSPPPVVRNGQNIVTNSLVGPQRFFRLNQ